MSTLLLLGFITPQVRAILCATFDLLLEGVEVVPKILVPMVCTAHELESILSLIDRIAYQVQYVTHVFTSK